MDADPRQEPPEYGPEILEHMRAVRAGRPLTRGIKAGIGASAKARFGMRYRRAYAWVWAQLEADPEAAEAAAGASEREIAREIEQTPHPPRVETVQAKARAVRKAEPSRPTPPPQQPHRWPSRPDYGERRHLTGMVGHELQEAARDAAAALDVSLSEILERALAAELERLERQHGGRFPRRRGGLPRGPRRK